MTRRSFLYIGGTGLALAKKDSASAQDDVKNNSSVTHWLSLSFDDGFIKSFRRIAEIHENFDLSAGFNPIASGHLPEFKAIDQWIVPELMGDFDDWNKFLERGHEIMPHSWRHENLGKLPVAEASRLVEKCTAHFKKHLDGFDPEKAVFNFPFNSSNPEIEAFIFKTHRAVRTRGPAVQKIPTAAEIAAGNLRIGCTAFGPENGDDWIVKTIDQFLAKPQGGWLVLNLHGLDNEGWGPISATALEQLLKRLVKIKILKIQPVGQVLESIAKTRTK